MSALYNEIDPYAAQWLRNLIAAGHIADGDVDERSIVDVQPSDLAGYDQVHFFAGIGGWSRALRLAGWADDRPVWTGSCPCQPFSAAGKRKGTADARHLWPEFRRLIAECRPPVVFGEQVASADGRTWLGGHPGLQRVQDREALVRVLSERNLLGGLPDALQGMLSLGRGGAQGEGAEGEAGGGSREMASSEPWRGAGAAGGISSEAEGFALHVDPGCGSGGDRRRGVPDDGHPVQSGRWSDVGQSVSGQDRQLEGVYAGEHEGRALRGQRDGEHLGREQDRRGGERDHGPEAGLFGRSSGPSGVRIEAASRFGELAGVRADLEGMGYAVGAADLCAAGAGAPHIRQRLWWVADSGGERRGRVDALLRQGSVGWHEAEPSETAWSGEARWLADADGGVSGDGGLQPGRQHGQQPQDGGAGGMGDADDAGSQGWDQLRHGAGERAPWGEASWAGDWLPCTDGKARRVEPGTFPLAHGSTFKLGSGSAFEGKSRVGMLRAYGNAIVPPVAAEFIAAFMECRP